MHMRATELFITLLLSVSTAASPALGMGPDPGGHTGDKVTPETTKTDRPEIDAKRKEAAGDRVETNSPPDQGQSKDRNDK
jgi:hypothetical protein